MQKSRNNGDGTGGQVGELGKEENFLFGMVMGFLPAYSVAEGLLIQKNEFDLKLRLEW